MTVEYTVTPEDIAILKRRVEYPCDHTTCTRAQVPGDYGYLGCGMQSTCERRAKWDNWWEEVQAAGLQTLAEDVNSLDALYHERQEVNRKITGVLAGINNRMGMKIMRKINDEIFSGQL